LSWAAQQSAQPKARNAAARKGLGILTP
jgi:hypothetical protein